MMLNPDIKIVTSKILLGTSIELSLTNNLTGRLWGKFMPKRNEILNKVNRDFISLQVYPNDYFSNAFDPAAVFTKYALVEVEDLSVIPVGMQSFHLEKGLYAVFHHLGNDTSIFHDIYTQWLPNSEFDLDNRPHFEVLGEKYKNNDPSSEEDIYIPIKPKSL